MARTAELFDKASCASAEERTRLLDEVILLNRCVAESIAHRYSERGISADDLRQTAYEGLVKAVHRFDPARQKDLLTFAVPTIRGELRRYFRDHGWVVRPPRGIQELQQRIRATTDQLTHDLGRDPDTDEVAAALDVSVAEYHSALATEGCFQPASLDQPFTDGGAIGDRIASDVDEQSAAEARVLLANALRQLNEREKRLIYLRFFEEQTQAEIGRQLGVTQMHVSRLLTAVNQKLRQRIENSPTACPLRIRGAGLGAAA
ncbi:sigma-70 family RNA polymerase sigma factor [Nocardioides sp. Bht2]|uniref:sigma-70 family RNA polymerase sigma factor n=1 Tax=Nocardioides sp. Bht2 TaxID=3392297 RepID=UPI0039B518E1